MDINKLREMLRGGIVQPVVEELGPVRESWVRHHLLPPLNTDWAPGSVKGRMERVMWGADFTRSLIEGYKGAEDLEWCSAFVRASHRDGTPKKYARTDYNVVKVYVGGSYGHGEVSKGWRPTIEEARAVYDDVVREMLAEGWTERPTGGAAKELAKPPPREAEPVDGRVLYAVKLHNTHGTHRKEYLIQASGTPAGVYKVEALWGRIGGVVKVQDKGTFGTLTSLDAAVKDLVAAKKSRGYLVVEDTRWEIEEAPRPVKLVVPMVVTLAHGSMRTQVILSKDPRDIYIVSSGYEHGRKRKVYEHANDDVASREFSARVSKLEREGWKVVETPRPSGRVLI